MKAAILLTCAALFLSSQIAVAQTTCPCADPKGAWLTDSTTTELPHYWFAIQGLKKKEARALSKCLGLGIGGPLIFGPAFRKMVCGCSPERVCFTELNIAEATETVPLRLIFRFAKR